MYTYSQLQQLFSDSLQNEISNIQKMQPHYLYQPVEYTLQNGGKRIRPVLLLMAYQLFSDTFEHAMQAAFAVEIFHNFTLLHDDIMDNSLMRRNKQTVHVKYSNNAAILSGDAMSILSYKYLNQCKSDNYKQILEVFTDTALQICEGQQYDMDFEQSNNVAVDEYLKMIGLKTAVLLAASTKIGALAANAPESDSDLLYNFGYNLGMAFQLQDDYLDSFGDVQTFGKNIGGDIVANKKTFLLLKAFELADQNTAKQLQHILDNQTDRAKKIEQVIAIYEQLQIQSEVYAQMNTYYNLAIKNLENVRVETAKKTELISIAKKMMKRVS
jgi:geranylgeranyl diphosphate synthase type II